MSIDGEIHTALMSMIEEMPTYGSYSFIWPGKVEDEPSGEYVRVNHLPNANRRLGLSHSAPKKRQGFLVLVLCSKLGEHEAVYRSRAGSIVEQIPEGTKKTISSGNIEIVSYTIKPGRREGSHWETAIWLGYRGYA